MRRITNPLLAIVLIDGHHQAFTVPTGSLVDTDGKKFNGERLIEVTVNGRKVLMFTDDLTTNSILA